MAEHARGGRQDKAAALEGTAQEEVLSEDLQAERLAERLGL